MRTLSLYLIFLALAGIALVLVRISNLFEAALRFEGAFR